MQTVDDKEVKQLSQKEEASADATAAQEQTKKTGKPEARQAVAACAVHALSALGVADEDDESLRELHRPQLRSLCAALGCNVRVMLELLATRAGLVPQMGRTARGIPGFTTKLEPMDLQLLLNSGMHWSALRRDKHGCWWLHDHGLKNQIQRLSEASAVAFIAWFAAQTGHWVIPLKSKRKGEHWSSWSYRGPDMWGKGKEEPQMSPAVPSGVSNNSMQEPAQVAGTPLSSAQEPISLEPAVCRGGLGRPDQMPEEEVECSDAGTRETVVSTFRGWCQLQPHKILYTWLDEQGDAVKAWSYRDVEQQADAVAKKLLTDWQCKPGDRVALMYMPGLEFIAAFWGCLFAGVVAVPVYPVDLRGDRFELGVERFGLIVAACEAKLVLSHRDYLQLKRIHGLKNALTGTACWPEGLQFHATDELEPCDEQHRALPSPEQLAFLQFTSGSTGDPKGVMLSHGNILHNTSTIATTFSLQSEDIAVSWLPQYHDMGLIGYFLLPASIGGNSEFMSPMTFLYKPGLWLATISLRKATYFSAPNFAFQRCVDKLQDILREYPMESLALGQPKVAMNAAEPIRPSTLEAFAQSYSGAGFRPEQWACTYGLAENVIYVSGFSHKPALLAVERDAMEGGLIVPGEASDDGYIELVGCGKPWPGSGIGVKIVDAQTLAEAAPDQVAEIWVSGPSKAQGYWGKPELSQQTFRATVKGDPTGTEYLRTGDIGFIHEGELYICGRLKDLIIINGRNIYPQDIERSAEAVHSSIRPGCSAAFGVELDGKEGLVLVAEVKGNPSHLEMQQIIQIVMKIVSKEHQLRCQAILLLKERTVPKTTSGKIRRKACKQGFLEWRQQSAAGDTTSGSRDGGMFGRTAHWFMVGSSSGPPALLQVVASSDRDGKVEEKKEEGGLFGGFSIPEMKLPSIPGMGDSKKEEEEAKKGDLTEKVEEKKEEGGLFGGFSIPEMKLPSFPGMGDSEEKESSAGDFVDATLGDSREAHEAGELPDGGEKTKGENDGAVATLSEAQTAAGEPSQDARDDCKLLLEAIKTKVLQEVRRVTEQDCLTADEPLADTGLPSIKAVEAVASLSKSLKRDLGISAVKLPSSLLLERSTVSEVAAFVASQISIGSGPPAALPVVGSDRKEPVCLTGMACSLAAGTDAPDELWFALHSRYCYIGDPAPPGRWEQACKLANAPSAMLTGAFLAEELEPALQHPLGGFSKAEASQLDIHVQLLLDTSLRALADASLKRTSTEPKLIGVFTGSQPSDFVRPSSDFTIARSVASALKVSGPHQNSNAACSSGYLATHHATQALQANQCPAGAVVAGVSLLLKPDTALSLYMMGILSPSSRMRPFDKAADGMVWGEASGALVLQPGLAQESTSFYCKLEGSAANCNGAISPSGFVEPDMIQQAAEAALASARIQPGQLAVCHPHGMGNPASDLPELTGLLGALAAEPRQEPLVLAGHKANFGHSVCAAGLISVVVSSLALRHSTVPVHLGVTNLVPILEQARERVLLPVEVKAVLKDGELQHGSISGTSVSGDNVHLALSHRAGEHASEWEFPSAVFTFQPATKQPASPGGWFRGSPPSKKATYFQDSIARAKSELHALYQELLQSSDNSQRKKLAGNITRLGNALKYVLVNIVKPILTKPGYSTVPPILQLQAMTHTELHRVEGFRIAREGFGQIEWDGAVDLRGADLDQVVVIERGSVEVYPAESAPPRGKLLNRPAVVTLCGPLGLTCVEANRGDHLGYDTNTGNAQIRVQHFSRVTIDQFQDSEKKSTHKEVTPEVTCTTRPDAGTLLSYSSSELADWARQGGWIVDPVKRALLADAIETQDITGHQLVEDSMVLSDRLAEQLGLDDSERSALAAVLHEFKPQQEVNSSASEATHLSIPASRPAAEQWLLDQVNEVLEGVVAQPADDLWDLGLNSQSAFRLTSRLQRATGLVLSTKLLFQHRTVVDLLDILGQEDTGPSVETIRMCTFFKQDSSFIEQSEYSACSVLLTQSVGIVAIPFVASFAVLPSYHVGTGIQYENWVGQPWSIIELGDGYYSLGLLIPLVLILWLVTMTVLVVVLKWLVVWKQCERKVAIGSRAHLRWWWFDRLLAFWEVFCGMHLADTIMLTLFYKLLGADIGWDTRLETVCLREPDLVSVGTHVTISGMVVTRSLFSKHISFLCVKIGDHCTIGSKALIMPGVTLNAGAIILPLSLAPPGFVAESGMTYSGIPMSELLDAPRRACSSQYCYDVVEASVKCILRLLSGILLFMVPYTTVAAIGLWDFNYWTFDLGPLMRWICVIMLEFIFNGLVYLPLMKLILIGCQKPGLYHDTMLRRTKNGELDYLFSLVGMFLFWIFDNTPVYSVWGRLLGANVGKRVLFTNASLLVPSSASLLQLGDNVLVSADVTFVPNALTNTGDTILSSLQIDLGALVFGPTCANLHIGEFAQIGVQTHVIHSLSAYTSVIGELETIHNASNVIENFKGLVGCLVNLAHVVYRLVSVALVLLCLVPPYLFACWAFFGLTTYHEHYNQLWYTYDPPMSRNWSVALVGFMFLLFASGVVMVVVLYKWLTLGKLRPGVKPITGSHFQQAYAEYLLLYCNLSARFLFTVEGSSFLLWYLRALGTSISPGARLDSMYILDCDLVSIGRNSVVDKSCVTGHVTQKSSGVTRLEHKSVAIHDHVIIQPGAKMIGGGCLHNRAVLGSLSATMPDAVYLEDDFIVGVPGTGTNIVKLLRKTASVDPPIATPNSKTDTDYSSDMELETNPCALHIGVQFSARHPASQTPEMQHGAHRRDGHDPCDSGRIEI